MAQTVGTMAAEYKAYAIGPDDQITSRIDLVCENDTAAKERAKQLVDGQPVELWRGQLFLGLFKPLQ